MLYNLLSACGLQKGEGLYIGNLRSIMIVLDTIFAVTE